MDKPIRRFQLAAQALVYTGLLSLALESGTASAQWHPVSLQAAALALDEPTQPPKWLLPLGGIGVLAMSFGIEIYRHRCFLNRDAGEKGIGESTSQALAHHAKLHSTTEPDNEAFYLTQSPRECYSKSE